MWIWCTFWFFNIRFTLEKAEECEVPGRLQHAARWLGQGGVPQGDKRRESSDYFQGIILFFIYFFFIIYALIICNQCLEAQIKGGGGKHSPL